MKRQSGIQSAVEYLLTYGWMILIISIILTMLLSVLSFRPTASFTCLGQVGFVCSSPELSTGGAVTIYITQGFTSPITVTGLYCNVTPSTKPPSVETTSITLYPNQERQLVFQCPILSSSIGSTDQVFLWMYYNTSTTPGQKLEETVGRGVIPVTYGGDIGWTVNEWTPSSNGAGMLLENGLSGSSGTGENGYLYWLGSPAGIYAVDPVPYPGAYQNLFQISGSFTPPSGGNTWNVWSSIWTPGSEQMDENYVSVASASNSLYNPATQTNQLGFMINPSGPTTEIYAYWIRDRKYPPSDTMPQTSFTSMGGNPSYVKIKLTNHQSASTGTNFQQEVEFNPNSYSSYPESSDLGNLRFYSGTVFTTQNELYSWCESDCATGNGQAIFWVLLPSSISGGGGTQNIYMVFPSSPSEYDGLYAGEAPELSSSYAEYDNGGSVFDAGGSGFYDNFAGTSLNSEWTKVEGIGAKVNNQLQLSGGVAYGAAMFASIPAGNAVVESDYEMIQTPSAGADLLPYSDISSGSDPGLNIPASTTLLNSTNWTSFAYGSLAGWAYGTDYHNLDLYNGIQTTLFPLHQLSEDDAPCSSPYASHGYTANTVVNMSGIYSFTVWTDDGTQIFYKLVSGSTWTAVFSDSSELWQGQGPSSPPEPYESTISFPKGQYNLVVEYTDSCDPAGLSVVLINPAPSS